MAGLGRKIFTRERATVADVNGYLMDQTVMFFASASARATQVPSPSRGMTSFLSDVGRHDWYTGSAWVPINSVGFDGAATSNASGLYSRAHGLGRNAVGAVFSLGPLATTALMNVAAIKLAYSDSSIFTVYLSRTDTDVALPNQPFQFSWYVY